MYEPGLNPESRLGQPVAYSDFGRWLPLVVFRGSPNSVRRPSCVRFRTHRSTACTARACSHLPCFRSNLDAVIDRLPICDRRAACGRGVDFVVDCDGA